MRMYRYICRARNNYYITVYGACEDRCVGEYLLCTCKLDDDNTDSCELQLSVKARGSIDYPGDEDIYTFTPLSSGSYTFKTLGDADTIGIVYDENGNYMAFKRVSCSEENLNCEITVELTADKEYYFAGAEHSSVFMPGTAYQVAVERSEDL